MKIGIVGSEEAKFTFKGKLAAQDAITQILLDDKATHVVSGHCHLGGIDIWAEDAAEDLGLVPLIFPPAEHSWSGGYKPRNLQIARNSDIIYCITVDKLPPNYDGMKFPGGCYHCLKGLNGFKGPHIKSGGCWTVLQGIKMGKIGKWIVVNND